MNQQELVAVLEAMASKVDAFEQQLLELAEAIGDLPTPIDPDPPEEPDEPDLPEEPEEPGEPSTGGIPKPLKEVKIANGRELQNVLDGQLNPGTHLVLAKGGDFSGSYTMRDAGTAKDPILIVGSKEAPVPFRGKVLTRAQFTGVGWLEFSGSGTKVDIGAVGSRVTRCLFDRVSASALIYLSGNAHGKSLIDFNDFTNIAGPILRSELQGDPTNHRGTRVERNHVNGHRVSGDNESVVLVQSSEFKDVNLNFMFNLFENCLKGATNQREVISLKTSGGLIKGNTFLGCNKGFISSRHSCRYVIEDCWFEQGTYIKVHGDDVVIRNCRSSGLLVRADRGSAWSSSQVPAGCAGAPKSGRVTIDRKCTPAHCGARRMTIENCVGEIQLGDKLSSRELGIAVPQDIVLRRNASKAKRFPGCDAVEESDIGGGECTAKKLTAKEVGRYAEAG